MDSHSSRDSEDNALSTSYYAPILFLVPGNDMEDRRVGQFALMLRRWEVSIFDLATLSTKHRLHLPYQLMDVFLQRCNMEIAVAATSVEEAIRRVQLLKAMLYVQGIAPTVSPYIATHSVNQYAGINSRDSGTLSEQLHEGLREGITSKTDTVEVWPLDLSLSLVGVGAGIIDAAVFEKAAIAASAWEQLTTSNHVLRTVQGVLLTAPFIPDGEQSILHIWTGIESLFPTVHQEVSFRIALYLAQLCGEKADRHLYFARAKKAYRTRSSIVHGGSSRQTKDEWGDAWGLLLDACRAILRRGCLPSEEQLLKELLS